MLNIFKLEQHIEAEMKAARVPGLALAIVKDQEIIYARGFGVTSVEDGGLPVTPRTLFCIGSTTKPLTGTAIMRLVEAKKLDLDTPVAEFVPWLTIGSGGIAGHITLRMLLSHTSGLTSAWPCYAPRNLSDLESFIGEWMPQCKLIAPPGRVWSYSNLGIDLAGYIAEVVTGKYYPELMRTLVFEPLEMLCTTYDPTVAMTYPMAYAHDLAKDGVLHVQHQFHQNTVDNPASQAVSTVLDLANFSIMHLVQSHQRR